MKLGMSLCINQQFALGPALCPEPDAGEAEMKLGVLSLRSLQSGWDEEAAPLHEIIREKSKGAGSP